MIESITLQNKSLNFVIENELNHDANIFTVITGKNGVGKSRLLSIIASHFLNKEDEGRFVRDRKEHNEKQSYELNYTPPPLKKSLLLLLAPLINSQYQEGEKLLTNTPISACEVFLALI